MFADFYLANLSKEGWTKLVDRERVGQREEFDRRLRLIRGGKS